MKLARLSQTTPDYVPFVKKVKFWRCLVQSGQLPSSFLQTSGPGSQTESAAFSPGSVWYDFVWLCGLSVASPLSVQIQEPRGYPCTNIDVIYPSSMDGVEWEYVIIEQGSVYPMFSGHNTICVVTALLVHIPKINWFH